MAEIRVEQQKKSGLGLLWLLLVLALVALAAWYFMSNARPATDTAPAPADSARTGVRYERPARELPAAVWQAAA
jgi:hypothetical protein